MFLHTNILGGGNSYVSTYSVRGKGTKDGWTQKTMTVSFFFFSRTRSIFSRGCKAKGCKGSFGASSRQFWPGQPQDLASRPTHQRTSAQELDLPPKRRGSIDTFWKSGRKMRRIPGTAFEVLFLLVASFGHSSSMLSARVTQPAFVSMGSIPGLTTHAARSPLCHGRSSTLNGARSAQLSRVRCALSSDAFGDKMDMGEVLQQLRREAREKKRTTLQLLADRCICMLLWNCRISAAHCHQPCTFRLCMLLRCPSYSPAVAVRIAKKSNHAMGESF
jgi:hypothetical protein